MMTEEAGAVGAAWSAARGWLTPAVLFVAMNLVIATIAIASRLVSAPGGGDNDDEATAGEPRGLLLRAPSSFFAVDRLRSSFSFSSRLGLAADHAQVVVQPRPPLSGDDGAPDPEPSLQQPTAEVNRQLEHEHQREHPRVERRRSEAVALEEAPNSRRRPLRARRAAPGEELDGHAHGEEVDARADDFIRRFREQLRLQRLDSILRYRDRDSLRRTGTA